MLDGFHQMDEHFRTAPFEKNLPVLMGLLTVWYTDFFGAQTVAVLPYENYLKRFPAYLQQLTMESNGKHVTLDGDAGDVRHRPDLLGRARHQRAALVLPADPPGHAADSRATSSPSRARSRPLGRHHDILLANVFAQAEALAFGKTAEQVKAEGTAAGPGAAPRLRGQPPVEHDPRRPAHAGGARQRSSRSTSTASSRRASSGTSTRSTSGASSWARRSRRRSSPSSRARRTRRSRTTAPRTT